MKLPFLNTKSIETKPKSKPSLNKIQMILSLNLNMDIYCPTSGETNHSFNTWVQLTGKSMSDLLCPICKETITYRLSERNIPALSPCERSVRTSIRYWGHILSFELDRSSNHTAQFNSHDNRLRSFPHKADAEFDIHPMLLQRVIFPYISKLDEEVHAPYRDAEVRTQAARLTGPINLQTLTRALNGEDSNIKLLALGKLSQFGEPEAVTVMIRMLNDENSQVRRYAVTLLSKTSDEKAVKAIRKKLKDSDARVRLAATVALGRLANNIPIE